MSLETDAANINEFHFVSPGGKPQDSSLKAGELCAELAELISQRCIGHAAQIAQDILNRYTVTRPSLKER